MKVVLGSAATTNCPNFGDGEEEEEEEEREAKHHSYRDYFRQGQIRSFSDPGEVP